MLLAETKPIEELAKDLGAEKFLDMVKQEEMIDAIKGAKTVFLPKDQAMEEFLVIIIMNIVLWCFKRLL